MHIHLVHWKTRQLIEDHHFYDSSLRWTRDKLGRWYVCHDHSGMPTDEWLKENPRPR